MPAFEVVQEAEVARLVSFSTGQVIPDMKDGIDFKCFADTSNKRKLSVTTNINSIEYSGENFGTSKALSTDDCDYYVAVQRKGSEKVQILPAELFRLNAKMEEEKDVSISDGEPDGNEKNDRLINIQKFQDLTSQFGSGKAQKALKKKMDRRVEDGVLNLVSQSVPTTPKTSRVANDGGDTPSEGDKSSDPVSSAVPPHNEDATEPENVYLLETIIPVHVMEPLTEQSDVFIKCTKGDIDKWREQKTYPIIVLDHLQDLPISSKERSHRCSLIMYLHCLMHTYKLTANQLGANRYPSEWKNLVKKLLDDSFTRISESTKIKRRTRPVYLKDLLLSHIMILHMRLSNYAIPLQPLLEGLKLNIKRLLLHARTLGFTVKGTVDKVATLKTPFKLPPAKTQRAKSKK